MFKDARDLKDTVGKVYDNVGMYVTDLKLEGGRNLEDRLTFLIGDSLIRDAYNVSFGANQKEPNVDFVVSGTIHQFDIEERSDAPFFNDRRTNRNIKLSTALADNN